MASEVYRRKWFNAKTQRELVSAVMVIPGVDYRMFGTQREGFVMNDNQLSIDAGPPYVAVVGKDYVRVEGAGNF